MVIGAASDVVNRNSSKMISAAPGFGSDRSSSSFGRSQPPRQIPGAFDLHCRDPMRNHGRGHAWWKHLHVELDKFHSADEAGQVRLRCCLGHQRSLGGDVVEDSQAR